MFKKESYELAQLTEVAQIAGNLTGQKKIDLKVDNIEEALAIYTGIYSEWLNGINNNMFKNSEEEGYIGAYAQRVLLERYSI